MCAKKTKNITRFEQTKNVIGIEQTRNAVDVEKSKNSLCQASVIQYVSSNTW